MEASLIFMNFSHSRITNSGIEIREVKKTPSYALLNAIQTKRETIIFPFRCKSNRDDLKLQSLKLRLGLPALWVNLSC